MKTSEAQNLPTNSELSPIDPHKEITPKDHLRVGIHTVSLGGNGDIATGAKLNDGLCRSNAKNHYDIRIYTNRGSRSKLSNFERQFYNSPIVVYDNNERDSELYYSQPLFNASGPILVNEDVMVFVHTFPDDEFIGENTFCIEINEYSSGRGYVDIPNRRIAIGTGLAFDNTRLGTIQAGLVFSRQYESLLDRLETDRDGMLAECEKELSEKVGRPVDLKAGRLGFYYASLINNNNYFKLLEEVAKHIQEPIVIVAPVGGDSANHIQEDVFAEVIRRHGFNYISNSKNIDQGGSVTIINPHLIPSHIFQSLSLLADMPMVVTGDQSLTEAIQRASSEAPCPFFVYTLGLKQGDLSQFIARFDPYVAQLIDSFYAYELTAEKRASLNEEARSKLNLDQEHILPMNEVVKLFYDPDVIKRFNKAMVKIPQQMIEDRTGYVDNPEDLIDVTKTLEKILEAIRMGHLEVVEQFMVRIRQ